MTSLLPSSKDLLDEAIRKNPKADLNEIHERTYELMIHYRKKYYRDRVNSFLATLDISEDAKNKVKKGLLKPIIANKIEYDNIMVEVSRRVSQTVQPLSGNIAELCAERELNKKGLKPNYHYLKKAKPSDFLIYHPDINNPKKIHRVEVKNVKLRERATRGLAFDGDSMFGFFDDPREFTTSNIEIINEHCKETSGYCYIPPQTLKQITFQTTLTGATHRFKSNMLFGKDMANFVKKGII